MEYLINLAILFSIYSMLALSLNLVIGMSGLVSLAQAAFYGIGAYATAVGMVSYGLGFFTTVGFGIIINISIACVIGKILSGFRGDYYAIVSAGLSIIVFSILLNWKTVTNGPLGIFGIGKPNIADYYFYSNISFLALTLFCTTIILGIYHWIDKSSFGRVLKSLREDEQLTSSLGYKTRHYKNFIFVLSAALSGIAGAFLASYISFIDPTSFQLKEGIFLFTIIIVGGLSSAKGSIAGALVLIALPEILRFIGLPSATAAQLQQIIYGALLLLLMLFKPQGLFGKYRM